MATTIGTESTYKDLLENLATLEHDAIAAYESTIERLDDMQSKAKIQEFLQDHLRHQQELGTLAPTAGARLPQQGDMKQALTTGKIAMADLFGDGAILKAMASNENDTVTAYERASTHAEAPADARAIFERAHQDELRHRQWMQTTAEAL